MRVGIFNAQKFDVMPEFFICQSSKRQIIAICRRFVGHSFWRRRGKFA
jgi:hypothetical protein